MTDSALLGTDAKREGNAHLFGGFRATWKHSWVLWSANHAKIRLVGYAPGHTWTRCMHGKVVCISRHCPGGTVQQRFRKTVPTTRVDGPIQNKRAPPNGVSGYALEMCRNSQCTATTDNRTEARAVVSQGVCSHVATQASLLADFRRKYSRQIEKDVFCHRVHCSRVNLSLTESVYSACTKHCNKCTCRYTYHICKGHDHEEGSLTSA